MCPEAIDVGHGLFRCKWIHLTRAGIIRTHPYAALFTRCKRSHQIIGKALHFADNAQDPSLCIAYYEALVGGGHHGTRSTAGQGVHMTVRPPILKTDPACAALMVHQQPGPVCADPQRSVRPHQHAARRVVA